MTGTNDFQPFAVGPNSNILAQSTFLTSPQRSTGFQSGVADSATANKVLRQSSWMTYLLSQWIVEQSGQNMLDDANYGNARGALIAAINALITQGITAGGFASFAALQAEAQARLQGDQAEGSARLTADQNEATARSNADSEIYRYAQMTFGKRQSSGSWAHGNFVPGDNFNIPVGLNFSSGDNGGYLLQISSVNLVGIQPASAKLINSINGNAAALDQTVLPMTVMNAQTIGANTSVALNANYVTTSGGGAPWQQTSLSLAYIFVAG